MIRRGAARTPVMPGNTVHHGRCAFKTMEVRPAIPGERVEGSMERAAGRWVGIAVADGEGVARSMGTA
jgi:hypothetical protein